MRKLTTSEFIDKAKNLHGDKYDYTSTCYESSSAFVTIQCNVHGSFTLRANDHLQGGGCVVCARLSVASKKRLSLSEFLTRANKIHANKYTYDKVIYKNTHTKVVITCPLHGDFEQKPNSHIIQRNGCPDCGYNSHVGRYASWHFMTDEQKAKPGTFYVLRFSGYNEEFIKIGITTLTTKQRYYGRKFGYTIEVLFEQHTTLHQAFQKEEYLKEALKPMQYYPTRLLEGRTECYAIEALPFVIR